MNNLESPIILDVGAHIGQTAKNYVNLFEKPSIYSFEPTSESFEELSENTKGLSNVEIFNFALGDKNEHGEIQLNRSSATNSLFATSKQAYEYWPKGKVQTHSTEKKEIRRLDDLDFIAALDRVDILKLDTQGSEYMVIEGATHTLKKTKLIYTEIIVKPCYSGQKHFDELLRIYRLKNFELFNLYNPNTWNGELRQLDAIFLNRDLIT